MFIFEGFWGFYDFILVYYDNTSGESGYFLDNTAIFLDMKDWHIDNPYFNNVTVSLSLSVASFINRVNSLHLSDINMIVSFVIRLRM
jgi:hypothetical protein